jgi:hypothetical protein
MTMRRALSDPALSRAAAVLAIYQAVFVDYSKVMVVGERPVRTFPDGVVNGQLDQKAIHDSKYQADALFDDFLKGWPDRDLPAGGRAMSGARCK